MTHFNETATAALNEIYDAVAEDFSRFYRILNKGDEDQFSGVLVAEPAKLSLNVDFYGRGKFPPGAFHSEGHQDGMGLCLYLALMKHTLGEEFRFSVLDDVLMSVDASHRREVCRLLKSEFPHTQFVLTTHDRVWLQYMKTEKLIERSQIFGGWTVDTGPRVWDDKDVWTDLHESLDAEKVEAAAALLRRYLEHVGIMLCDGLRAPVQFRGDGQYTLGDLLPPGLKKVRTDLKAARQAAQSWGKTEFEEECAAALKTFEAAQQAAKIEEWTVNPSVHYNEWANFQADEFRNVAKAYKALIGAIRCETCQSLLHASFNKGQQEELRCICGEKSYNLVSKKPG